MTQFFFNLNNKRETYKKDNNGIYKIANRNKHKIFRIYNTLTKHSFICSSDWCDKEEYLEYEINEAKKENKKPRLIHSAIKELGYENFKIELIEEGEENQYDNESIKIKKQYYLDKYDTLINGFNKKNFLRTDFSDTDQIYMSKRSQIKRKCYCGKILNNSSLNNHIRKSNTNHLRKIKKLKLKN